MRKKLSFLFILASFSFSVLAQSNNSKFVDNRTYFRSSTSIEIENMIYFVTMFYDSKMFAKGEKVAMTFRFYLLSADFDYYTQWKNLGGFNYETGTYVGSLNNNTSQSSEFPTRFDMLKTNQILINKHFWCYPTFDGESINVLLFNGNNNESIKIDFLPTKSSLFETVSAEAYPFDYVDSELLQHRREQIKLNKTYEGKSDMEIESMLPENYLKLNFDPSGFTNIDDENFPNNTELKRLLVNNSEFNLNINKQLYLEIMKFSVISYDYVNNDIVRFLKNFDKNYSQYANNEFVIIRKTAACINLIRESIKKINLGEIFYKDMEIQLDKYDFDRQDYTLLRRGYNDQNFFFNTMRLNKNAGYSENGPPSIYLTNWGTFSDLKISSAEAENLIAKIGDSKKLSIRLYFLIEPVPCFENDKTFSGVIAYGLKADLFKNCYSNKVGVVANTIINNASDKYYNKILKRCYNNALFFLNNQNVTTNNKYTIEKSAYLNSGAVNIAYWSQSHPENCETGYFMLNGKIEKENQEQALITFYIQTNYYYVMQPGYEIKFSNTNSGASYPLVVKDIVQIGADPYASILQLTVKITKKTIMEMLNSRINDVQIQISGTPKYQWTGKPVYNWDETIKSRVDILGAHYNSSPESIINFFKKGL